MPDQDQMVDGASIRGDKLHLSEPQTVQLLHIAAQVVEGDIWPHLTGLQKVVELVTGFEAQQAPEGAVFL